MEVPNNLYSNNIEDNYIKCKICSNYCKIPLNCSGFCKQYQNINNRLFNSNFGIVSSVNVDPIEKKPLYHFLPNTLTYSVGGFGCNMGCLHCQNYMISQYSTDFVRPIKISPEAIVENAIKHNCKSIAWTYNEPTIHLPFNKETSLLGKNKNLKIIYVSNGFMSEESLNEILKFVDAFNIDLKGFSSKFYREICKSDIQPVLDNLKTIYESGKHLEITNLLINGYNDSNCEITQLVNFIVDELDANIPLFFSRAFPYYKMENITPTSEDKIIEAKNIAEDLGMKNIYTGNIPLENNSYCPNCNELLIKRNGFSVYNLNKIKNNRCTTCGYKLNFEL